jgi:multicomponent Na+:H+ antiporter subunit F
MAMAFVALGLALSTYRLIIGPDVVDRIIALDVIGTLATGMILLEAIRSGRSLFMDIALCMAILLFLTTVAFALYYKKGGHP